MRASISAGPGSGGGLGSGVLVGELFLDGSAFLQIAEFGEGAAEDEVAPMISEAKVSSTLFSGVNSSISLMRVWAYSSSFSGRTKSRAACRICAHPAVRLSGGRERRNWRCAANYLARRPRPWMSPSRRIRWPPSANGITSFAPPAGLAT